MAWQFDEECTLVDCIANCVLKKGMTFGDAFIYAAEASGKTVPSVKNKWYKCIVPKLSEVSPVLKKWKYIRNNNSRRIK